MMTSNRIANIKARISAINAANAYIRDIAPRIQNVVLANAGELAITARGDWAKAFRSQLPELTKENNSIHSFYQVNEYSVRLIVRVNYQTTGGWRSFETSYCAAKLNDRRVDSATLFDSREYAELNVEDCIQNIAAYETALEAAQQLKRAPGVSECADITY